MISCCITELGYTCTRLKTACGVTLPIISSLGLPLEQFSMKRRVFTKPVLMYSFGSVLKWLYSSAFLKRERALTKDISIFATHDNEAVRSRLYFQSFLPQNISPRTKQKCSYPTLYTLSNPSGATATGGMQCRTFC